jgi:hypothetical protein
MLVHSLVCIFPRHVSAPVASKGSVVGIATVYTLRSRSFESRLRHEFSLVHIVQTGFRVHPASYQKGKGGKAATT